MSNSHFFGRREKEEDSQVKNLSIIQEKPVEYYNLQMQGWEQMDVKINWNFGRPKIRRKALPELVKKQLVIGLKKSDSILIEISKWKHFDNSEESE